MQRTFWTTAELHAAGWSKDRVASTVAGARLIVVRRGHYATPDAPADVVRAARVGGAATSVTAARQLGLWAPPDHRLHVAVPHGASRLRDPADAGSSFAPTPDVCLHWTGHPAEARSPARVVPVTVALEHAFGCLRPEWALAMLDSALHTRHLSLGGLAGLVARLPRPLAEVAGLADGRAESGLESIARYLLVLMGLHVEVQVVVPGVGRVDLLVEGRLIIELDGRAWHDDPVAFARDRRRDAAAVVGRYRVLRFDYRQVLSEWPTVEAAVLAALAA